MYLYVYALYACVCIRAYTYTHTLFVSLKFEKIYFNLYISMTFNNNTNISYIVHIKKKFI